MAAVPPLVAIPASTLTMYSMAHTILWSAVNTPGPKVCVTSESLITISLISQPIWHVPQISILVKYISYLAINNSANTVNAVIISSIIIFREKYSPMCLTFPRLQILNDIFSENNKISLQSIRVCESCRENVYQERNCEN